MYGTFIGMITAITILIIYCFAHGEDACGMSPHHGCFVGTDDIIVIARSRTSPNPSGGIDVSGS
jgi:hypothetical protein